MIEKRIPKQEISSIKSWFAPVLGGGGSVLPTHEKQLKDGKNERIEHLSAYVQNGYLSADVLDKLHKQIYEEVYVKAEANGYQNGYNKGFDQGVEAGKQSGYQENCHLVKQEVKILQGLIKRINEPLDDQEQQLEKWILDTVESICIAILRKSFEVDENLLIPFVKDSIAALPAGSKHIEIHLCEDDIRLLEKFIEGKQLPWKLYSDRDLGRGDCRVISSESKIDFTLAARIEQAFLALTDSHISNTSDKSHFSGAVVYDDIPR